MPRRDAESEEELDELERAEAALAERQHKSKKSKNKGKGKEKERSSKGKGRRRDDDDDENNDNSDGDEVDEDDSDDEAGARRGTAKAKKGLSESDITEKARDLVRFAICNEASRRPLRRDEINKKVLAGATRLFQRVFDDANDMLKQTFGMELVALYPNEVEEAQPDDGKKKKKKNGGNDDASTSEDDTARASGKKRRGAPKMFCLRSTLPEELIRKSVKSNEDLSPAAQARQYEDLRGSLGDAFAGNGQEGERRGGRNDGDEELKEWKRGEDAIFDWKTGPEQRTLFAILYVILSLILVNERVLTDDQLQGHLKRLDLKLDTPLPLNPGAIRPEKQTVNSFLQTLIRQQYLEKSKLATGTNAKGKGGSSSSQAAQTQTQRVRATQGTAKKPGNDDAIAGGDPDAEWRWGPRAFREVGEDGIASFIKDFYRSHSRTAALAGAEVTQKDSKTLMADILRGASGGKPNSKLVTAKEDDEE